MRKRKRRFWLFRGRRRWANRDDQERIRWCIAMVILVICLLTVPSAVRAPVRRVVGDGLHYTAQMMHWVARRLV